MSDVTGRIEKEKRYSTKPDNLARRPVLFIRKCASQKKSKRFKETITVGRGSPLNDLSARIMMASDTSTIVTINAGVCLLMVLISDA
jgi:hypothetical protein